MPKHSKVESVPSKSKRLSSKERREQLLSCAIIAYANHGVERAGHGDVAKLAGVSTATVFNYFATRELLTEAVFEIIRQNFRLFLAELPNRKLTASQQVKYLANTYDDFTETRSNMTKVMLNWSGAFGPEVRVKFLEFQDELLTLVTRSLHGDIEDRTDARLVLAAADVFAQMKLDHTDEGTIARFVDRIANALD